MCSEISFYTVRVISIRASSAVTHPIKVACTRRAVRVQRAGKHELVFAAHLHRVKDPARVHG